MSTVNLKSFKSLDAHKAGSLGRVGLKAFFKLSELWKLKQEDQLVLLGNPSRSTLNTWRRKAQANENVKLPMDTVERLSLILGIRKGVEVIYPKERWNDYMRAPNRQFNGHSLLDVMLEGRVGSLYTARRFLDAARGAHFG